MRGVRPWARPWMPGWAQRWLRLPAGVLAIGLLLSGSFALLFRYEADARARTEFFHHVAELQVEVQRRLDLPTELLRGLAGLHGVLGEVTPAQFQAFVASRLETQADIPGLLGAALAQPVNEPGAAALRLQVSHRAAVGGQGGAGAHGAGTWLDLAARPALHAAVSEAATRGVLTLVPVALGGAAPEDGLLVLSLPLYRGGEVPETLPQRRGALVGVLFAPVLASRALQGLDDGADTITGLTLDLTLSPAGSAAAARGQAQHAALYDSRQPALRERAARFDTEVPVVFTGRTLMLRVRSTPELEEHIADATPWWVLAAGCLLSALVAEVVARQASRRRLAEQRARQMTAELERLAMVARETSNAVIITDADGRITWVNAGFERLTGWRGGEVLGQRPGSFLQCEQSDPATVARMRLAIAEGQAVSCDILNQGRHGRRYWLDLRIQPVRDGHERLTGFVSIQTDISERKQAEETLLALQAKVERSEQLLRGAIDTIDEAFVVYGPDDRLVYCNDKYRQVYAESADLLVPGTRFEDILRFGAERGQYAEAVGRVEAWVAERLALHHAGSALVQTLGDGRVLRILERPMPDGHVVGFRVDVTDLYRAKEAAERASHAKSSFIATVSHELRTPLQSIMGFSDLGMHFAQSDSQFHQMFADIHDGGRRMLQLVNGLLDVSRLEGSEAALSLRPVELTDLCAEVVREVSVLADRKDIQLVMLSSEYPLVSQADPFRFQQVVRNVLANAIRFAPPVSSVALSWSSRDGRHELQVRDHGPGIPPAELESIFEPFTQSTRTADGSGGTGLGLTICRKIMRAHAGQISAANADGGGAVFRIWLPAARPASFVRGWPLLVRPAADAPGGPARPVAMLPAPEDGSRSSGPPARATLAPP